MVESVNCHIPALLTHSLKPVKKLPRPQPVPPPPQPDFIEDSISLSLQSNPKNKSLSFQAPAQNTSSD